MDRTESPLISSPIDTVSTTTVGTPKLGLGRNTNVGREDPAYGFSHYNLYWELLAITQELLHIWGEIV